MMAMLCMERARTMPAGVVFAFWFFFSFRCIGRWCMLGRYGISGLDGVSCCI